MNKEQIKNRIPQTLSYFNKNNYKKLWWLTAPDDVKQALRNLKKGKWVLVDEDDCPESWMD